MLIALASREAGATVIALPAQSMTEPSATDEPEDTAAAWYANIKISLPYPSTPVVRVVTGLLSGSIPVLSKALLNPVTLDLILAAQVRHFLHASV